MIKKIRNFKFVIRNSQAGMTFIELVVVLGIYAVLSLSIMFSYPKFQAKVDIENLANDIAQQVVQAQNAALNGLLSAGYSPNSGWKPSYGVYFNSSTTSDADNIAFNKKFIYFIDNNPANFLYDGSTTCTGECISKYTISKNDYISDISYYLLSDPPNTPHHLSGGYFTISFTRPNSGAIFSLNNVVLTNLTTPASTNISFFQITISSPIGNVTSTIQLYPSGRVQIS